MTPHATPPNDLTPPEPKSEANTPTGHTPTGHSPTGHKSSGLFWSRLLHRADWLIFTLVFLGLTSWFVGVSSTLIVQAELALGNGDIPEAFALAQQVLQSEPDSDRALLVAAASSLARQDLATAADFFQRVSERDPEYQGFAQRELGRIAMNLGQAIEAERHLRKSRQLNPDDNVTTDQLIYLLTLEGRQWEARQLIFEQLRSGVVSVNYLVAASRPDNSLEASLQFTQRCLQAVPDDPLPKLSQARQAWRDNQPERAQEFTIEVIQKHPELLEAHALLCRITTETGSAQEFIAVHDRLPANADTHPDIWLSRGVWAENQGQTKAAARCYWESLRLNPDLIQANYRLAQTLVASGLRPESLPFAERAQKLTQLNLELTSLANQLNLKTFPAILDQLDETGRLWEAAGWCHLALQRTGTQPPWLHSSITRIASKLAECSTYTHPSRDPSRQLDLSHFPLPIYRRPSTSTNPSAQIDPHQARITFEDQAAKAGLIHTYQNGASHDDMESLLEMNGGGIAVLDYDGDGWPDMYLTQGGTLPPAPFDPQQHDLLFRNQSIHGDQLDIQPKVPRFSDVTYLSRAQDLGYGQGATVGDFDNDGFPDLYVGNIGQNQLYHNNGDGTFTDVTIASGTQAGGWTSSCVLADFNGDTWPDLYVVTYLAGETPFQPCNKRVRPRCGPLNYPAQPDRFYLNRGDGTFVELTGQKGLGANDGRGLGVVAADFEGSGKLSLFVANDMSANFYFRNITTTPDAIQFEEQALLSGLAFDHLGQAKACMGIAAGDFNHDERLDLHVTNFYRQSNDLYAQEADGTFHDVAREARLFDPSFLMLGWGTQFLDGDLDGHQDLIITNGHVHDPVDPAIPYHMPSQFLKNSGTDTFTEIPADQLGDFFKNKRLGRSLARLDWNRDGREDACISYLNDPSALLTNTTATTGNFLSVKLVAVNSARDAIGSRVRVVSGNQSWTQQLTAGDGFQASNERLLVFGLGHRSTIDRIEIVWPSGAKTETPAVTPNQTLLIIEDCAPFHMPVPSAR